VHPWSGTVSVLTDCRLLEQCIHFVGSVAEWFSVGEAETGSGGSGTDLLSTPAHRDETAMNGAQLPSMTETRSTSNDRATCLKMTGRGGG